MFGWINRNGELKSLELSDCKATMLENNVLDIEFKRNCRIFKGTKLQLELTVSSPMLEPGSIILKPLVGE